MATLKRNIANQKLLGAINSYPDTAVSKQAVTTQEEVLASKSSRHIQIGTIAGGFKSIGQPIISNEESTKDPVPVIMESKVPGLTVTETASLSSEVSTMIGETVSNGFLHRVVTHGSPEGIKLALKQSLGVIDPKIETAVRDATLSQFRNRIVSILRSDIFKEFNKVVNVFKEQFINFTGGESGARLQTFFKKFIPGAGNLPRANESITEDQDFKSTKNVLAVTGTGTTWNYGSTPENYKFEIVSTEEELEIELRTAKRELTEVIVGWTGNFMNEDITAKKIHTEYARKGPKTGIPYHYIIRKDGTLQRGIPLGSETKSNTVIESNHNKFSIVIGFVAKYDCDAGTPNKDKHISHRSITIAQMKTFDQFCSNFYSAFPGGQVLGMNDLTDLASSPGFDVRDYVHNRFGKGSVFADPRKESSLSPKELVRKRVQS